MVLWACLIRKGSQQMYHACTTGVYKATCYSAKNCFGVASFMNFIKLSYIYWHKYLYLFCFQQWWFLHVQVHVGSQGPDIPRLQRASCQGWGRSAKLRWIPRLLVHACHAAHAGNRLCRFTERRGFTILSSNWVPQCFTDCIAFGFHLIVHILPYYVLLPPS